MERIKNMDLSTTIKKYVNIQYVIHLHILYSLLNNQSFYSLIILSYTNLAKLGNPTCHQTSYDSASKSKFALH
jgi:hypothetical protein